MPFVSIPMTPLLWKQLEDDYVETLNAYRRGVYERMPRDLQEKLIIGSMEWSLACARFAGCVCSEHQLNWVGCDCAASRKDP